MDSSDPIGLQQQKQIEASIQNLYLAYYEGDKRRLYQLLDRGFRQAISLHRFTIHLRYDRI